MRSGPRWTILFCFLFFSAYSRAAHASEPGAPTNKTVAVTVSKLPLRFEPNVGQAPATTDYLAHSGSMQVGVSGAGLQMQLPSGTKSIDLAMTLIGAKQHPQVSPLQKALGETNYLLGPDPGRWQTHIP
jgi:hypothetical protein